MEIVTSREGKLLGKRYDFSRIKMIFSLTYPRVTVTVASQVEVTVSPTENRKKIIHKMMYKMV